MSTIIPQADSEINSVRTDVITRNNHYVPRLYLKHFASESGYLYRYRILVPSPTVADWKRVNIGGVGYQSHLYTRALSHGDSDEIEQWLNRDFETPAASSICKAINDERLEKEDYRLLVRFLAAQIVRTPAFMIENLPRWQNQAEKQLQELSQIVRERLERAHATGEVIESEPASNAEYYPLRVTREPSLDGKSVLLKTETVVGRGTWIYAMRHLLTNTLDRLSDHKWVILSAENDLPWFTTDDPVVRLNFRNSSDYDFKGGWGVPKTNIFLPLSPKHLLFTQVGEKTYQRGEVLPRHQAIMLRRMIAEHAHRYIFSPSKDSTIPHHRPRVVDAQAVRNESEQWQRWHEQQSVAERELAG
ncbi:DUF4238 domain-containing protein [Granulicella arctica]|uniref:DUF4238 domain-containing protein n=1 Tax=Granulicella arctica TaxID=940613 RepID=A0A7Y9TH29_9BACT|nr:DUF4238 domain-containing protein [Granulicella arctica]NYF80124.1 hypothetical protein [Granulicella arctica]